MPKIVYIFLWTLFSTVAYAQKLTDNFEGKWRTEDGYTIEILKKGKYFEGRNVELDKVIFDKMQFIDNQWETTMVRPRDGMSAHATLNLQTDRIDIMVRKGIFSKKLVWRKVE